jgi:hypothetical protein
MPLTSTEKEHRVKQLAKMFANVVAGIDQGVYTNAVLVPFSLGDTVEVVITSPQGETLIRRFNVDENTNAT